MENSEENTQIDIGASRVKVTTKKGDVVLLRIVRVECDWLSMSL